MINSAARKPLRILLVEDNPGDEELLRGALIDAGVRDFVMTWVQSLAEAHAQLAVQVFDGILLDLVLPDGKGLDALAQVLNDEGPAALAARDGADMARSRPAVVVLTGHDDSDLGVQCVARGAQDFLVKGSADGALISRSLYHAIERQRSEAVIRSLNSQLEQRVAERTQQLAIANEQLEAFVYSASHDLKQPLRSVEGLISVLQADFGESLDADGQALLSRAQRSIQRMDTLIDALLKLSVVGRQSLSRQSFDLARLTRRIFQDLLELQPHRIVTLNCPETLTVFADPALLEPVMQNLIANALKFTSRAEDPHVELGVRLEAVGPTYFVRDNGVGFDMRFVDKLFRAFQRLHGQDDFAGTGVGLATVARAVRMHGGEVHAESEPGRGACFSFTLAAVRPVGPVGPVEIGPQRPGSTTSGPGQTEVEPRTS